MLATLFRTQRLTRVWRVDSDCFPRLQVGKPALNLRNEWGEDTEFLAGRTQDHDGNIVAGKILLLRKAVVHRDQNIEGLLRTPKQLSIFHSLPAAVLDRLHLCALAEVMA